MWPFCVDAVLKIPGTSSFTVIMTSMDRSLYRGLITSSIFGTAALFALIFIPAGTIHYWQGWAYVAVAIVASGGYTFYLAKHDPALLKRRSEAGISHEMEPAQKVIITFLFIAFIALIVLPPLDARFGWSASALVCVDYWGRACSIFVLYLFPCFKSKH